VNSRLVEDAWGRVAAIGGDDVAKIESDQAIGEVARGAPPNGRDEELLPPGKGPRRRAVWALADGDGPGSGLGLIS
jgi:hypothetical protein